MWLCESLAEFCAYLFERSKIPAISWLTVKGGNSHLPSALAQKLYIPVQYGKVLKELFQYEGRAGLIFQYGEVHFGDIILLAIPCSVFKDIKIDELLIPSSTLEEMQKVQYGTNAKVILPCAGQESNIIMTPTMASWTNQGRDLRTFYYGGQYGIWDIPNLPEIANNFPFFSSLPSPKPANDDPFFLYKAGVFKSWVKDPYAQGSYSNWAFKAGKEFRDVISLQGEQVCALFKPLNNNTLFFAGEHTVTNSATVGKMEGAIESGERMARLIDHLSQK